MKKKTRNELLGDVHDLRMYLEGSTHDNIFPPSLVIRLVKALAEFHDVVREMDLFPSNEAVLEMLKEKINHGFLKESEVVDALIGNTREQSKKR